MSGLQCQNYSTRREDDSSDESEQGEMDEDEEEEIPLDMEVKTVDQHKARCVIELSQGCGGGVQEGKAG